MLLRTVVLALAMPGLLALTLWAESGGTFDAKRRAQLESGNAAERGDVLAWLAEHGSQSDTAAVILRLRDADGRMRVLAEQTLWSMWMHSGNNQADAWLGEGSALMAAGLLDAAVAAFTRIVEHVPAFAEGYNKRATALYLRGDFEASLIDIADTLKRNPSHFGALSGAGLCLMKLGRPEEALFYFDRALAVNPNLEGIKAMAEELRTGRQRSRA